MSRQQHLAISRMARLQALRELPVFGNLTLKHGSKSCGSAVIELQKNYK